MKEGVASHTRRSERVNIATWWNGPTSRPVRIHEPRVGTRYAETTLLFSTVTGTKKIPLKFPNELVEDVRQVAVGEEIHVKGDTHIVDYVSESGSRRRRVWVDVHTLKRTP